MSNIDHPFGFTDYEAAEELGLPRCRKIGPDSLAVWERLSEHPAYVAEGFFYVSPMGPQLVGLTINPWSHLPWPPPLLSTSIWRSAPTARLYEQARGYLSIAREIGLTLDVDLGEFKRDPRPGKRGRPDVFYAGIAKEYVDLLGESTAPTRDLAQRLGYSSSSLVLTSKTRVPQFRRPSTVCRSGGGMYSVASQIPSPSGSATAQE